MTSAREIKELRAAIVAIEASVTDLQESMSVLREVAVSAEKMAIAAAAMAWKSIDKRLTIETELTGLKSRTVWVEKVLLRTQPGCIAVAVEDFDVRLTALEGRGHD